MSLQRIALRRPCSDLPGVRHVKAGLSAMRNKTDRNDARGIAQLVRLGWFRQVYVKSEEAQRTRMLLVNRQQLLTKALDIENSETNRGERVARCRAHHS